ncbi:MAG TPA: hypothetical protein DEF41_07655 [Desulfovibrio sp.]|nr:hypothetical protein [Desulfovibrio sp.]
MDIIYAKKFRIPDNSANMIQGVNMVAAFNTCGVRTHAHFSVRPGTDPVQYIRLHYGVESEDAGNAVFAPASMRGLRYLKWLCSCIIRHDDAIIYTREGVEAQRAVWLRNLHRPRLKVIHEIHKFDIDIRQDTPEAARERSRLRKLLSNVSGAVFIDDILRQVACDILRLEIPTHVAPSGFNPSCIRPCRPPVSQSPIMLGYFGKVVASKGLDLLVAAFRLLPGMYRLRLVGDATDEIRKMLKGLAGEASERLEFTGRVEHAHLAAALDETHLSIIPAVSQTLYLSPLKLYESLAMGLPLVCTPMPHLKKVLTENEHAVFASSMTPETLAAAIRRLGEDAEMMRRMRDANTAHSAHFSWNKRAEGIISFIQHLGR